MTVGDHWLAGEPEFTHAVKVVAPHPDDEVLGAAGVMMWADSWGCDVSVIAVTDGEASHAASTVVSADELRVIREIERHHALVALELADVPVLRLGFPDAAVERRVDDLTEALGRLFEPGDTVIVPARADQHPDHRATCLAGRRAAAARQANVYEVPIWSRLTYQSPPPDTFVLELDEGHHRQKLAAVSCFRSQLEALGDGAFDGPVLDRATVTAMTSTREWLLP